MTVRHLKTDVFVLFSLNYIGYHQYFVFRFFFFHPCHFSHSSDFPLFSGLLIISLLLQKATPLLGFKTKGWGQEGGAGGRGSRGQKEKKAHTPRKKGKDKDGGDREGEAGAKRERKKWEKQAGERQRKGVSRSKSVRATCLFVRQVIKTKAQDQPTAFRALTGANLNIRWSSPLANAAFLWYLFSLSKSLMVLVFQNPA